MSRGGEENPKVSVAMLTYNHERFITQAVESALAQQTEFPFEIVIGDDASQDDTRSILLALQRQHPTPINLLLHDPNIGGLRNLAQVLEACRGDYVAILEGDDYWTDAHKLQKQVDYLDAHPEIAICHHDAITVDDNGRSSPGSWHQGKTRQRETLDELLRGNFIVTCTVMFRNHLFPTFPAWFFDVKIGDWPLHMLNAQHGDIAYLNEVMGAYRVHEDGIWSTKSHLDRISGSIATAELMRTALPLKHKDQLARTIDQWHDETIEILIQKGQLDQARRYAMESARHPDAYRRLDRFCQGLEDEAAGRRGLALKQFLSSLRTGRKSSRIGMSDILIAAVRTSVPLLYTRVRGIWRRLSREHRSP